ncbi:hypothetical protein [Albimonas pacifica]|uniref:VanZ like family protein n=1 Tax=Albimonas pacifica TaxID=1114924 RepID=A0A1I3IWE4_9RHOB|nr:hypothetical protein [Albimonas pacifica]SFI52314.1 hypothetical protein SAMN05216258_107256 [Albimonas pacifica]
MSAAGHRVRGLHAPGGRRRARALRIAAWAAGGALAALSLAPASIVAPGVMTGGDRHVAAYAVAALLARLAWPRRGWTSAGALLGLALALEALQALSPGREPSLVDLAASAGGTALGALLAAGALAAAGAMSGRGRAARFGGDPWPTPADAPSRDLARRAAEDAEELPSPGGPPAARRSDDRRAWEER